MALIAQSKMASGHDNDLMDIDIDMDLDDAGQTMEEELQLEEGEEPSFQPSGVPSNNTTNLIPAIYTEDPALEPAWEKIHIRGVDDFHTSDIQAFVHDNFPEAADNHHVQWIDDTSANIVFKTPAVARQALLAIVLQPVTLETIQNAPFEFRATKPLASRPGSLLTVRVAQQGDRKKKNARDASRFYLLHPEVDPTERMRKEFANNRNGRSASGPGDYRRRRFDDQEHRRRRDKDYEGEVVDEFTANMYDDAPAAATTPTSARGRDLFSRVSARRRSASPTAAAGNSDEIDISDSENDDSRRRKRQNGYRDRTNRPPAYSKRDPNPFPRKNVGKELFGDNSTDNRTEALDLFPDTKMDGTLSSSNHVSTTHYPPTSTSTIRPQPSIADQRANAAAAKRLKADLLSAQTSPRSSHHRRSHAMDAKNAEDLAERFARKSISIDSTKSFGRGGNNGNGNNMGVELFPTSTSTNFSANGGGGGSGGGFNIKGTGGLSIKGRATAPAEIKELFPDQYRSGGNTNANANTGGGTGRNEGKELFDQPVREKKVRYRAGDLFD